MTAAVGDWADGDGRSEIANMGFPLEYKLQDGPEHWRPTSEIALQQKPLLPDWGENRTFATPMGATCDLPPPHPLQHRRGFRLLPRGEGGRRHRRAI